ncbi:hypothetical protein TYRP_022913, partial [Tyrophagus putrescentiae]
MVWAFVLGPTIASIHCKLVLLWIYEQVRFQSYRWTRAALFYLSAFTLWMSLCALTRVILTELRHVISTMREKGAEIHGLSQEKLAEAQPMELIGIIIIGLLFLLLFLLLNKDTTNPSLLRGIPPPLPILEEHSFCKWEKSLRLHLENENLLTAIERRLPASSRVNRLVLEKITQGVPGHLSAPLKGKDTAFDAFDSLKKEMISRSESLCSDLLEELKSKKLISFEAEAVRKHIEKFNSYANQLTDLGDKTTDSTLLRLLGNTLPADHDESKNKFSVLAQQLNSQGTLASGIDLLKRKRFWPLALDKTARPTSTLANLQHGASHQSNNVSNTNAVRAIVRGWLCCTCLAAGYRWESRMEKRTNTIEPRES